MSVYLYTANKIFFVLSNLLLVYSLYKVFGCRNLVQRFVVVVINSLLILISLIYIVAYFFTNKGIDGSVIYHIAYGLEGAGFQEYWEIILFALVTIILYLYILFTFYKINLNKKESSFLSNVSMYLAIVISIYISPVTDNLAELYSSYYQPDQDSYLQSVYKFREHYKTPEILSKPDSKKNLVYIYAEQLERTYFDENKFPGLIKHLKEIEKKAKTYTDIRQVTNTNWTMAGMVASQCGIPLFTHSNRNAMMGVDLFYAKATCLGDLLKSDGYGLNYFGGASLRFAGKGKFYKTHGFTGVFGRDELVDVNAKEDTLSWWGLYDDELFDRVFKKYTELKNSSNPFGIFLLSLDTHHPTGHPSPSCENIKYKDGSNEILNAVACSDYLIAELVNKIINSDSNNETVVVVSSDHLSMRNTAWDDLQSLDRRNMLMVIDSDRESEVIDKSGSLLDIAPTLLNHLGYESNLGLGRNLRAEQSLLKSLPDLDNLLFQWRRKILQFWGFPTISGNILIELEQKKMIINENRQFEFPLYLAINKSLQTEFKFIPEYEPKKLSDYYIADRMQDENKASVWIDECEKILTSSNERQIKSDYCVLYGNNETNTILPITSTVTIDFEDIKNLVEANRFEVYTVAHAGGGYLGDTYTNSIEAINLNLEKGFKYFEIDFSFTSDDKLVCLHDWEESYEKSFSSKSNGKLSLKKFNNKVQNNSKFHNCTLESLAEWMELNSNALLITDVKERNLQALARIKAKIKDFEFRVIPQIYQPEEFQEAKELGFENIIWTLYRYSGDNDKVLEEVNKMQHGNIAITMPTSKADTDLPHRLKLMNIPTYVHTINDVDITNHYINNQSISGIYTDFIDPVLFDIAQ